MEINHQNDEMPLFSLANHQEEEEEEDLVEEVKGEKSNAEGTES